MIISGATMTEMWHRVCEDLLFSEKHELDAWSGVQGNKFNCLLTADSMEFDFDVGRDLWLTKSRFPKLQRDYLDPAAVPEFLDRCVDVAVKDGKRGMITSMPTKNAEFLDGKNHHRWGNCMMGFSYQGGKKFSPPTFSLFSRTTYIAYLGPMDLAVAWLLAREVCNRIDLDLSEMKFTWYLGSAAWHTMKSIPYVIAHGMFDEVMNEKLYYGPNYPCVQKTRWSLTRMEQVRLHEPDKLFKYGPQRRMMTRYIRVMNGNPMPSIPVSTLNLLPEML